MSKNRTPLLPTTAQLLVQLGDRLRLARLRRGQTAQQVAERAGMTPMTLRGIERGAPNATIGAYLAVLQVLGFQQDIVKLAAEDPLGRALQDANLKPARRRSSARKHAVEVSPSVSKSAQPTESQPMLLPNASAHDSRRPPETATAANARSSTLTTSESLAELLKVPPSLAKKLADK